MMKEACVERTALLCMATAWWWAFGALHELFHLMCAAALRKDLSWCTWRNLLGVLCRESVALTDCSTWEERCIRHVGWLATSVLAYKLHRYSSGRTACLSIWITAFEAFCTDALGWGYERCRFRCGNLGLIVLSEMNKELALDILQTMIATTMIRGAQAGGMVTYGMGKQGVRSIRARVVKGKRQDLSLLLSKEMRRMLRCQKPLPGPHLYVGHTRFATASIATLPGTHPHVWCRGRTHTVWTGLSTGDVRKTRKIFENHITHNGDFDRFNIAGQFVSINGVQKWLEQVTGVPRPCEVDSAAIAGMMDILHTRGVWYLSLRYAFLFTTAYNALDRDPPSDALLTQLSGVADGVFESFVGNFKGKKLSVEVRDGLSSALYEAFLKEKEVQSLELDVESCGLMHFLNQAVTAFFEHDLMCASHLFLRSARGSFGLCATSNVSAHRQVVIAARGQPMSVAIYPRMGLVLYGSQQAAVKAAIGIAKEDQSDPSINLGQRLDLDDLGGEICLLDWGEGEASSMAKKLQEETIPSSGVRLYFLEENLVHFEGFKRRLVPLQDNPLVLPLPERTDNPVLKDMRDICSSLSRIEASFFSKSCTLNLFSAWSLARKIEQRMKRRSGTANTVDILLTGCEVSLWTAEQFASDLSRMFPNIVTRCISANKLLALKGQNFPHPPVGSALNEHWILEGTIVIVVSHSGETFSSLAVANLLTPLTSNIFVITSEWDTQLGRQLRKLGDGIFHANVFSTELGLRSAEPCSVTVVATHHLMTQILIYLMEYFDKKEMKSIAGAIYTKMDINELKRNNRLSRNAVHEILGENFGSSKGDTPTCKALRRIGRYWALHVLELPISWMLSAIYILGTVTAGYPMIYGICVALGLSSSSTWKHIPLFFDALLYVFVPQWTALLLRLVQGRPLFHRLAPRTVVIADVPWVSQSSEAFLSKLFATSFTNTCISVYSGNPSDHLVHKFTHRVMRGTLVAFGRPDGRLTGLTAIESSICLAANQVSSIQHYGVTCESLSIGHNPVKLPMAMHNVFLPSSRPDYLCERLLKLVKGQEPHVILSALSSGQLVGEYENFINHSFVELQTDDESSALLQEPTAEDFEEEEYYGQALRMMNPDATSKTLSRSQERSMLLYETRIASMQRLVSFFVLFYEMGYQVQQFWKIVSFGLLKYDMSTTHSIMRVATTASPVSAADILEQLPKLEKEKQQRIAERLIGDAIHRFFRKKRSSKKGRKHLFLF